MEFCVNYQKDLKEWGDIGCLGYPAATLLFSIAETIGSYLSGVPNFIVEIEGKKIKIKNTREYLYILNSDFYGNQNLKRAFLDKLYKNYRSLLTHNSVMAYDHFLGIGTLGGKAFEIKIGANGGEYPWVNILPFYEISKKAIEKFLADLNKIWMNNEQVKNIELK